MSSCSYVGRTGACIWVRRHVQGSAAYRNTGIEHLEKAGSPARFPGADEQGGSQSPLLAVQPAGDLDREELASLAQLLFCFVWCCLVRFCPYAAQLAIRRLNVV